MVGVGFGAEVSVGSVAASCAAMVVKRHSEARPVERIFCNIAMILLKDEIGTASGLCQKLE